jgi:hypothetical protein
MRLLMDSLATALVGRTIDFYRDGEGAARGAAVYGGCRASAPASGLRDALTC